MSDDEMDGSSSSNAPVSQIASAEEMANAMAAGAASGAGGGGGGAGGLQRRKRKEPPPSSPASAVASAASARAPGSAMAASVRPSPAGAAAVPPSQLFESHLLTLSPQQQTSVQNDVLSLVFPEQRSHHERFYKNLPGPQPISIMRAHLEGITKNEYWCCEKSDGERAMLFISKSRGAAYLLDRKFLVKQIRHPLYVELWGSGGGDTLLDGELVLPEKDTILAPGAAPATFMAFDVLVMHGARTMERNLSARLETIGRSVVLPYRERYPPNAQPAAAAAHHAHAQVVPADPEQAPGIPLTFAQLLAAEANGTTAAVIAAAEAAAAASSSAAAAAPSTSAVAFHPLAIRAKSFHRKHHVGDGIFRHITPLGHDEYQYDDGKRRNKNDGVIFTPENDNYFCKQVPLLKWKWQNLNTIDFLTRAPWFDSEGRLMLYSTASTLPDHPSARPGNAMVHVRSTMLTAESRRFFLREVQGHGVDTAIAEMKYDTKSSSWQPKNFRWDKSTPNFMTTVIATMETIIDNVTKEDLCRACAKQQQPQHAQHPQSHHQQQQKRPGPMPSRPQQHHAPHPPPQQQPQQPVTSPVVPAAEYSSQYIPAAEPQYGTYTPDADEAVVPPPADNPFG